MCVLSIFTDARKRANLVLIVDQVTKSVRGMPWHMEPMKDVVSCDKPRGAANKLRSGDVRMGQPNLG